MGAFITTRRVEFCHTDAGGIMHFSGYFQLMEQAEHELFRHLGLSVFMQHEGRTLSWPRVSAKCEFTTPAHFEDELEIRIGVARVGKRSVTYAAQFFADGQRVANGEVVTVCCVVEPDQPLHSIDIPASVAKKLASYKTA